MFSWCLLSLAVDDECAAGHVNPQGNDGGEGEGEINPTRHTLMELVVEGGECEERNWDEWCAEFYFGPRARYAN